LLALFEVALALWSAAIRRRFLSFFNDPPKG
jgi:hypothetical protein